MKQFRHNIIRAGLETLYRTGAHHLMRPMFGGIGVIFMLHHVRPARHEPFQPNRHLEVTPEFLGEMLRHLRERKIDVISMEAAHERLARRDFSRRFACFTLDDGYRDNRDFALPVMREFDAPLTVYVTTEFAEGTGRLWWIALEQVVAKAEAIEAVIGGVDIRLDAKIPEAKQMAFDRLHDWLRGLTNEQLQREISALCARHRVDEFSIPRKLCLSWEDLKSFAADPLVTIGAHTLTHSNLAKQSETEAYREMAESRSKIEGVLQKPVQHFAYPYGDRLAAGRREFALARRAGFRTAVTTRPGMMYAESAEHMTALSRLSLNGNYQDKRILPVLTSGAATAVWNGFRRIDTAWA